MSPTPEETFAGRLREQRRAAKLTQAQLADRMSDALGSSVYVTIITKIESGDRTVRLNEAAAAAQVLGVPLASLLDYVSPIDVEIDGLRRKLTTLESRERAIGKEYEQVQLAMADIERQIATLESSRSE